jgi:hypothetical protein
MGPRSPTSGYPARGQTRVPNAFNVGALRDGLCEEGERWW